MDLLNFAKKAAASVLNGGGAAQPEWLRLAIAERLKAREAGGAESPPADGKAGAGGAAEGGTKVG